MRTLAEIKKQLKKLSPYLKREYQIRSLGIFGSYAKGSNTKKSDIDILVKFSKGKSLIEIIRIERELSEILGLKVDMLTEQSISTYLIGTVRNDLRVIF